ncbi:hypothetical protein LBMAG44_12500 [Gemmatimonadota bacterium]|nr:hypothetical protein LBMAG44_12500 [Gemmatimonadota bacterium]
MFVESLDGTFRAECLNGRWFDSLYNAPRTIEAWCIDYDYHCERPHSRLRDFTPRSCEFAFALAHYTFRFPIHRTDIILGTGLGDTSPSGPISQSLNCKSSSSDRPKCHDKTYDK